MRLLLDTHVLLWWLADHARLSASVRAKISSADAEVWVSLASAWEIAIKISTGKLQFPLDALAEQLAINHFQQLPMTLRHIATSAGLPFHHRDPFDRMLIAQAMSEQLVLVTGDDSLTDYEVQILRA